LLACTARSLFVDRLPSVLSPNGCRSVAAKIRSVVEQNAERGDSNLVGCRRLALTRYQYSDEK
jgi:hypothetical protein